MNTGYFCPTCKVPIIGDICEKCGRPMATPKVPLKISPVFKEELQMLADVTGEPVDEFNSLELWTANRYYYYEGRKIFKVIGGNLIENPKIEWVKNKKIVLSKLEKNERLDEKEYCRRIKEANRFALGTLEERSIRFIQDTVDNFEDEVAFKAISFSGGKDSAVLSHLVRKAFGSNGVLHIFADTTLENPDTLSYIKSFEDEEKIFLLKAEPQQSFSKLVEKALFPSRIYRWCCIALKIAPIERLLRQILDSEEKILMFEGARREESLGRQKYEPIELDFKIASEIIVRPILEWNTLEEWIYILSMGLSLNDSYRRGMRRVGCSLCPLARGYSEFLMEYWSDKDPLYHKIWNEMKGVLICDIKKRGIDIKDLTEYLKEGKWKGRAGGSISNKYYKLAEIFNWKEDYKFIRIDLSQIIELSIFREYIKSLNKKYKFKSFETQMRMKTILILSKEQEVTCKITMEGKSLHIWWFADESKMYQQFLADLKKQLIKYQFCTYCGGCETKCAFQAITVDAENQKYIIDTDKCIGCGECININNRGCLLADSARVKDYYKIKMGIIG